VAALFVMIGAVPRTDWLDSTVLLDGQGFVLTGDDLRHDARFTARWPLDRDPYLLETSVPGVFAAGDVRHGSVKRVASAVGEGAMSVSLAHRWISQPVGAVGQR
jgi:thioredoxin reductase (NADPH)